MLFDIRRPSIAMRGEPPCLAGTVFWTNWDSATAGASGSASGTIALPNALSVSYAGEVSFAQVAGAGTDWWLPGSTYTSPTVSDSPSSSDIIAIAGGNQAVDTITFSKPVTDPVMAIFSLGSPMVTSTLDFAAPFKILSSGPNASLGFVSFTELPGDVLQGNEGNGTIQFQGTFTSISWTNPDFEFWHGFTVGLQSVPEPSSVVLLSLGVLCRSSTQLARAEVN